MEPACHQQALVEALRVRAEFLAAAEVPLADVRRGVTRLPQRLRQRALRRIEVVFAHRADQRPVRRRRLRHEREARRLRRLVPAGGQDAVARGVFPGHDAGARGRAQRVGIRLGEARGPSGEAINVRRLVIFGAINSAVHPAHVIHQKKEHVGLVSRREGGGEEQQEGGEDRFHGGRAPRNAVPVPNFHESASRVRTRSAAQMHRNRGCAGGHRRRGLGRARRAHAPRRGSLRSQYRSGICSAGPGWGGIRGA